MRKKIVFWMVLFILILAAVPVCFAVRSWMSVSASLDDAGQREYDVENLKDLENMSAEPEQADESLSESVNQDSAVSGRYIFDKQKVSSRAGEQIRLKLYIKDSSGSKLPASDVSILIYDANNSLTDKKADTDSKGTVTFSFEKAGIYYAGVSRKNDILASDEPDLCRITVKKASIKFVNKKKTLKIRTGTDKGLSKTLKVKVNGKRVDASKLIWRVGNKKTASVKNGIVTAKKEGRTFIYASIYHTTAKFRITILDKRKLVVIDPGHQAHQDLSLEPVGPGAKEMKMKVSSGTAGKYSGSEYQLNLTVSKKLKKALAKKNYRVLMTRTTNDVNISNRQRAEIANEAGADAFIRIHANSSASASDSGIMTICPTKSNPYCPDIYEKSRRLSDSILKQMKHETGTTRGYVWETDTMTGINWCRIPVTIIELGFQSNPDEDRKLALDAYQDKLVNGIAAGLDGYFHIMS